MKWGFLKFICSSNYEFFGGKVIFSSNEEKDYELIY